MVNWRRVIPEDPPECTILLDPEQTTAVLKELSPIAKNDAERVVCEIEEDGLALSAYDVETESKTQQNVQATISGSMHDPMFAFNHKFALDYLSWQNEAVTMELTGVLHAFKFSANGSTYILMPMQIM